MVWEKALLAETVKKIKEPSQSRSKLRRAATSESSGTVEGDERSGVTTSNG